ncbi:MAG: glycosyltransferase [Candidatus Eremiobacterota bacterium]
MSTFLFAGHPGMGHLNPLMTIAGALEAVGHRTVFAGFGPATVERQVTARGFTVLHHRPVPSALGLALLPALSGVLETWAAMRLFTAQPGAYARALIPTLKRVQPACVVADFSFPGAGLAAEVLGIPWVSIYHAGLGYPGPGVPPMGTGLPIGRDGGWWGRLAALVFPWVNQSVRSRLGRARRALGLAPPPPGEWWSSPWVTLILSADFVEAPRTVGPRTFFVGPCIAGRSEGGDFPFEQLSGDVPNVYVSLGTVFNNKPRVFLKIVEAFRNVPVQLVVSAGGAYERLRNHPLAANALLFPRVPQLQVLPRVDAVISHGGNNTVNETLAAGKPLLVMPVGGEQGDNASRVEFLGAGLRADLNRSSPEEIRTKVLRLLREASFRERAHEAALALARTNGPDTVMRFLLHVADTRKPVERPAGYPLTVTRELPTPWSAW